MSGRTDQTAINALLCKWQAEGISTGHPVGIDDIFRFEHNRKLRLPDDFKQYLSITNGMEEKPPKDVDKNGYSFWPLERMRNAAEEFSTSSNHPDIPLSSDLQNYLIFADYMQWSWAFAIKLVGSESVTTTVYRVDSSNKVHKIADTFLDFLQMYVSDAEDLYKLG